MSAKGLGQQQKNILYKENHLPKDAPEHWKKYIQALAKIVADYK